jgi:cyclin B
MENLVFFLMELSLMQYVTMKFPPSMLAAAAVYTAQCTLGKTPVWNGVLKCHTGYSEIDLK